MEVAEPANIMPMPIHSKLDVCLAGLMAGMIGGLLTNPLEFIAVNKQADPQFMLRRLKITRELLVDMLFRGSSYRVFYYGIQSMIGFILLDEFCLMLNVDITEYD